MRDILAEEAARRTLEQALGASDAPDVFATLSGGASALTRWGAGDITQNVERQQITLAVTVARGLKAGSSSTDDLTDDAIRACVARADEIARLSPEDPERMPSLGEQSLERVESYVDATADCAPEARARGAVRAMDIARGRDLIPSGTFSVGDGFTALASKAGLWAYHTLTDSGFSTTMRTPDGTGSSRVIAADYRDVRGMDIEALSTRTADRAVRSANPQEIPPGEYTVVLEPQAVADLLAYLLWSMEAREADEDRSFFSGKMGERIVDERITMVTQPAHPELRHRAFTDEGLPKPETTWIEGGVLRNLDYSRYWAQRQGRAPTPSPTSIVIGGGDASVEDLVRGTQRGLLISRFWYIRMVDPKRILVTGLTRDGTFRIENGEVVGPVINYRFNDSPVRVLGAIEAMSRAEKAGSMVVPALRVTGFNLTSPSRAV